MKKTSTTAPANRVETRNPTQAPVSCRLFTSGAIHACDGVMRNFSSGGSYIETSDTFAPGSILLIRMHLSPPLPSSLAAEEGLRTISLAEVKWRRQLSGVDAKRYGIGLRYLD